jgi:hypothetical protein
MVWKIPAHPRPRLTEHRVVRTNGQVTQHVQNVPPSNGVTSHHGHHGLGTPSYLHLKKGGREGGREGGGKCRGA